MDALPTGFWIIAMLVLLALAFDFMNGFHDAANSIATVVATRVLSPLQAVVWAAFFNFVAAFTMQTGFEKIGIGAWLGTIMLINVWGLIWPNQKKILGLVQATDEQKNKARRIAFLASRTNTALSIPMLFFMVAQTHIPM